MNWKLRIFNDQNTMDFRPVVRAVRLAVRLRGFGVIWSYLVLFGALWRKKYFPIRHEQGKHLRPERLQPSSVGLTLKTVRKSNLFIAVLTSAVLVGISLFLAAPGSTYRWSFLLLLPLVWAVYFWRERLALLPAHFAAFALAIIIHDLGTFGFYKKIFFGLRFDCYVHFMFGLVAGLILFRAASEKLPLSRKLLASAIPIFVLGIGGIHEMFECFTTILLGPERGMLKLHTDQPFDTQKDLMNNTLGAIVAVLISLWHRRLPSETRSTAQDEFAAGLGKKHFGESGD